MMAAMHSRALAFLSSVLVSGALVAIANGCGSDSESGPVGGAPEDASTESAAPDRDAGGGSDAGGDAAPEDAGADAPTAIACTGGKTIADSGETCTGFGKGDPCDTCTPAGYGYVCIGGGPPNIAGCLQVRATSFGETYCCPTNDCVAEPDQDSKCNGKAGKPHRYQCPPTDADGGFAKAPQGCVDVSTPADPYPYYCCP